MNERRKIQHLFWRAGMGLSPAEAAAREGRSIGSLVDELFAASREWTPITTDHVSATRERYRAMSGKERAAFLRTNRENTGRLNVQWLSRLARTEGCLREKLAFFWHGHFACWSHWSLSAAHYLNTLREHALGDFGTMLKAVSRAPAMLEYLNNQLNRKDAPNENFAREVMELFTLGRGQYSEQDIHEAARAFTGWAFDMRTATFEFRQEQHDAGEKTFRGKTGRFDGDAILDLILGDPQCARFLCRKIYRWFVHPQVDEAFVDSMADRYFRSGYDTADLMRSVFTSDHFFAERNIGARIKSPVDLMAGLDKLFAIGYDQELLPVFLQRSMGQVLLQPPSVAGWTEGAGWIDSNALMMRLKLPAGLLNNGALDWNDPEESAAEMDMMPGTGGDAPLRDARGRVLHTLPDWEAFLAQLPAEVDNPTLARMLLQVDPSPALSSALTASGVKERVMEILCSPEYQLC